MAEVAIRPAGPADADTVFVLYKILEGAYTQLPVDKAAQAKRWDAVMADRRQHVLVAEKAGAVIGTLTLIIVPNLGHHGQPWAAVTNVAVAEAERGQGTGTRLLTEAGRLAREADCYKIVLSSNLVRSDAHEFYRRLGWKQTHIGFSLELA